MTRTERFTHLTDAIEDFVNAKIDYDRRRRKDPDWASTRDVDETREALIKCLEEFV